MKRKKAVPVIAAGTILVALCVGAWIVFSLWQEPSPGRFGQALELRLLAEVGKDDFTEVHLMMLEADPRHEFPGWVWLPWVPISGDDSSSGEGVITSIRDGQTYVLAADTEERCMKHSPSSPPWGIKAVEIEEDDKRGWTRVQVQIEFDREGGRLLRNLSGRCLKRKLAVVVDGRVVSAPVVQEHLYESAVIDLGGTSHEDEKAQTEQLEKHRDAAQKLKEALLR